MSVEIKQKNPGWLDELAKRYKNTGQVAIGYPLGTPGTGLAYPDGTLVFHVAVWNQFGVPEENIPRRDFMGPGGRNAAKKTRPIAIIAIKGINKGTLDMEAILNQMGAVGSAAIGQAIVDLKSPPNSPVTIFLKKSSNPLVDTGLMGQAVTWALRK